MSERSGHRWGSYRRARLLVAVVAALASMVALALPSGAASLSARTPARASRLAAVDVGITGTVTDGTTGLAAIDVRIYDALTGLVTAKTRTLADGTYEVAVPAGAYKVRFSDATGGWRLQWFAGASTIDAATTVTVPGAGTTVADAVLVHPLTLLAGQAETATDRIIPLPGIDVRVYDATTSAFAAKAVTGASGSYSVADLPPGRYLVRFSDPAGTYGLTWYPSAASILGAVPVVVATGSPARADGLIWPTADLGGTVRSSTGALPGIAVRLYDANTRALVAKTISGADGTYTFTHLHMSAYGRAAYRVRFSDPADTYALQWFPGQATEDAAGLVTIDVRGSSSGPADALMVGAGGVAGHVGDSTGSLAGISVRVYSAAGLRVAKVGTGPDGRWSVPGLAAGTYKINLGDDSGAHVAVWFASATTFAAATPVTVTAGSVTDIGDQLLTPSTALALVVDTAADSVDANPGDGVCDDALGRCSLRAAVDEANAGPSADTITIAPGVDPMLSRPGPAEDANATGDLDSTGPLTIHGNGATIDAVGLDRALQQGPGRLNIDDLIITGGTTAADHLPGRGDDGGAILAMGDVSLTDTTLRGNAAVRFQSGRGGGIAVLGSLTMTRGTVSDNTAENLGGGIWAQGASVVITDSTIDGNRTSVLDRDAGGNGSAGAVDIGSNELHAGVATISGTTISNNVSTLCCGSQSGGGLLLAVTTATVVNSTIVGNAANMVPGGFVTIGGGAGVSGDGGHVALIDDTVADNTGYEGIYQILPGGGVGPFTVQGSIIIGATPVCNGAWITLGWNLLSDTSCHQPYSNPTDRIVTDALLGPLADNGGLTSTRLPLLGSAALDAVPVGSPGVCDGTIAADQRGIARPQGAGCDIGAVERAP